MWKRLLLSTLMQWFVSKLARFICKVTYYQWCMSFNEATEGRKPNGDTYCNDGVDCSYCGPACPCCGGPLSGERDCDDDEYFHHLNLKNKEFKGLVDQCSNLKKRCAEALEG